MKNVLITFIFIVAISLAVVSCEKSSPSGINGSNETEKHWYVTDGTLDGAFYGLPAPIEFTLIQKYTPKSVTTGFVLHDLQHYGYNFLMHKSIKKGNRYFERWSSHWNMNGVSEIHCIESLNDSASLPATLRLVSWAHVPFDETRESRVEGGYSQWSTSAVPIANFGNYELEQTIDSATGMPRTLELWSLPNVLLQMGVVSRSVSIQGFYMPAQIDIQNNGYYGSVRFRNGEVVGDEHSVRIINAYLKYMDLPNDSC